MWICREYTSSIANIVAHWRHKLPSTHLVGPRERAPRGRSMRSEAIPSEARKSDKVLPDRTYYATPGPRDVGPGGFSIVSDGASSNDQVTSNRLR